MQTAPAEAYRKFDDLSKKHIDTLRGLTKNIQDARLQARHAPTMGSLAHSLAAYSRCAHTRGSVAHVHARNARTHARNCTRATCMHVHMHVHASQRDNELIKRTLKLYDDALERYIPVLMSQAGLPPACPLRAPCVPACPLRAPCVPASPLCACAPPVCPLCAHVWCAYRVRAVCVLRACRSPACHVPTLCVPAMLTGEDILGHGALSYGGEDLQAECGVLLGA